MMKCGFCGYEFSGDESKTGCRGCPLSKRCNKYKCPNCGYEMPKEPKLIEILKKWGRKNDKD